MSPMIRSILGPDFQSLVSKVLWTFVQAFGGFLISARVVDGIDADLIHAAFFAGVSAVIVPITVYARMMIGGSSQPQSGAGSVGAGGGVFGTTSDDDIEWDD